MPQLRDKRFDGAGDITLYRTRMNFRNSLALDACSWCSVGQGRGTRTGGKQPSSLLWGFCRGHSTGGARGTLAWQLHPSASTNCAPGEPWQFGVPARTHRICLAVSVERPQRLLRSQHHGAPGRCVRYNMSIDTDPQQQEAASPQMLVVRSFSRYVAQR